MGTKGWSSTSCPVLSTLPSSASCPVLSTLPLGLTASEPWEDTFPLFVL